MTITLKRYYGCLMVGMQAHMLGKVVLASEHVGLAISQLHCVQWHIQDLCLMETIMWEANEETSLGIPTPS
jgi:hypothetical protein